MRLLLAFPALFLFSISALATPCGSIQIIGWTHNSLEESQKAADTIVQARSLAQARECLKADALMKDFVKQSKRLSESQRVLQALQKNASASVGLEYSEAEQTGFFAALENNLKSLNQLCPQADSTNLVLILDPAFAYSRLQKTRLIPLEDTAMKRKLIRSIASETFKFVPEKENLNASTKKLARDLIEKDRQGEILTQNDISSLVRSEKDESQKAKLQRVFTEFMQIQSIDKLRNAAMAVKALSQKDISILVGQAHVTGLQAEFARLCRQ